MTDYRIHFEFFTTKSYNDKLTRDEAPFSKRDSCSNGPGNFLCSHEYSLKTSPFQKEDGLFLLMTNTIFKQCFLQALVCCKFK